MGSPSNDRMRFLVRNHYQFIPEVNMEDVVKEAHRLYSSGAGTIENAVAIAAKNHTASQRGGSTAHGTKSAPRGY